MMLNHKNALDYIFSAKEKFRSVSVREIENIHRLLIEGLGVSFGIRAKAVGITGTNYRPLGNAHQVREALARAVDSLNAARDPWNQALLSLLLISYIQPFEDGNKRTSRLLANACLLAHDACPLSLRSIDETEYKNALILQETK